MDIVLRHPDDASALSRLIRETTNAKQRDRYRAVELAIAGEKKTKAVMRMLARSRGFVQRWCYTYRDHGLDAVVAKSPPGPTTRLGPINTTRSSNASSTGRPKPTACARCVAGTSPASSKKSSACATSSTACTTCCTG